MLLTSGQVSAAISSGVVFIFTAILFISGYVLQQQSIRNLNAMLHPGGHRKGPWDKLVAQAQRAVEAQNPENFRDILAEPDEVSHPDDNDPWRKRAYIQSVRSPDEVCNAVMSVTSLSVQGSPARRVLLYPAAWDAAAGTGKEPAMELVEIAKREHLLETIPVNGPVGEFATLSEAAAQAVRRMLGMGEQFERLVFLQPEGMIINASRLDQAFEVETQARLLDLGMEGDGVTEMGALLVQPEGDESQTSVARIEEEKGGVSLNGLAETTDSIRKSRSMKNAFVQGQLLGDVGYLHLTRNAGNIADEYGGELRRRGGATIAVQAADPLLEQVLQQYRMNQETICGGDFDTRF